MRGVILGQRDASGVVPFVVPNVVRNGSFPEVPQAVWDHVVIIVPWALYKVEVVVGVVRLAKP